MNRHRLHAGVTLFVFLSFSIWKFDVLWASIVSCTSFVGMVAIDGQSAVRNWNASLLEYWVACFAWVAGWGAFFARLYRTNHGSVRWSGSQRFLVVMGFVALTAPLVTPVSPNAQGDPVHTRLLPPGAVGTLVTVLPEASFADTDGWFTRLFKESQDHLLHASQHLSGRPDGSQRDLPTAERASRIIFLFGTDDNGRDVFSRVVYGSRASLGIGLCAAIGALCIGTLVGFLAGYSTALIDSILMRFTDLMLAIPSLFLVLGSIAFLPNSVLTLILVLALTGWMGIARTVRAEVLRLRQQEFVLAARLLNQSSWQILLRHILPNLKTLLITAATLQVGNAVLAEASLSFLGLGIQPPTATWGNILGDALSYVGNAWWMGVFPGVALTSVLIAIQAAAESFTQEAA